MAIYLEFTNNDPDVLLLKEGFGSDLKEFLDNNETAEMLKVFLVLDQTGMSYQSSVFSKFALENACNADDVVEVIYETVVRLASSHRVAEDYNRILRDLMRFNYLKSLCRDGNYDRTFRLYDRLSAIPAITQDDLFWNAFGMCERARFKYSVARKHFNTSIANAKNRGPNYVPYHAQNQLIVCILEAAIQEDLPLATAHMDLLECTKLLIAQADDERANGTGQAFAWFDQLSEFGKKYFPLFDESQSRSAKANLLKYKNFIQRNVQNWESRTNAARMVATVTVLVNRLDANYPS